MEKNKFKTRIELAQYFGKMGYTKGAEIGVCTGYFSEILLQNIPNLFLYAVDYWKVYKEYRIVRSIQYELAKEKLSKYNCQIIKAKSMDAVKDFENESLDFVYIDANHGYDFVKEDVREWTKKVRVGGMVAGHDYHIPGVKAALDEYVQENGYTLGRTGWCRSCAYKDNRQPSWYFVKTH